MTYERASPWFALRAAAMEPVRNLVISRNKGLAKPSVPGDRLSRSGSPPRGRGCCEARVDELDGHCTFAHCGGDPVGRARADVARREDTWDASPSQLWTSSHAIH